MHEPIVTAPPHATSFSPPFSFRAPRRAGHGASTDTQGPVIPSVSEESLSHRLEQTLIAPRTPIADALRRLNDAGTGILLMAGEDRKLTGVISDGDIRRHLLAGGSLDEPCSAIATRAPLVASPRYTRAEVLYLMDRARDYTVDHLPVVTDDGVIVGLVLRRDLVNVDGPGVSAVIMAGGSGTRLRPLTEHTPKPMLPLGDRPLLERTVERLRDAGIRRVRVTTHYLAEHITSHFGDGRAFGVDMQYIAEDRPLGTAGSLKRLPPSDETMLVMNGDILTTVDFHDMLAHHRKHRADATIGARRYDMQVPYGVLECAGIQVRALREKPVHRALVNAGIYLLEPSALAYVPDGERFDMTDLIQRLLDAGRRVVSFLIVEYWLDIGQHADYQRAQDDVRQARV
ncbi:MAG TPA: nucleotidyltransferase family protein [Gemmatimonadaceae bacterium]|nr:nucleotidyltransferase family protein [Gemmatimonadaceae bacterium]